MNDMNRLLEKERQFSEERVASYKQFHEEQMLEARFHSWVMFLIGWLSGAAGVWAFMK